jgi:adenylate cyclase
LRSISIKIFGMAVLLLIMLAATSIWSALSSQTVQRQLQTLSRSLFPLAGALAEMRDITRQQTVTAKFSTTTPDPAAVAACQLAARSEASAAEMVGRRAEAARALGARIAVLERNRLELARLEPMIAELRFQHVRLSRLTLAACRLEATPVELASVRAQADDVMRLSAAIADEVEAYVADIALVVAANQEGALRANILMVAVATLVGLLLASLLARGLTRPILRLQAGARAVRDGQLDQANVTVTTRDEIGDVSRAFNAMVADLKEKDRIKETFGQFIDPRVVSGLIEGGASATGGEKKLATIYFSDLVGFTGLGERLAPSSVVALLNAFFSDMTGPIREHDGIVDKYIGDAIMAFWAPPFADPANQARAACTALLAQRELLHAFQARVPDIVGLRRDVPRIDFRAALATGEVVVGSVGPNNARSFTVIGDAVNFCSRLEATNKIYGTKMLIDGATADMAGVTIATREIDTIMVSGKSEPMVIHQLADSLPADRADLFGFYAEALAHYRAGNWSAAEAGFVRALALLPDDGPSIALLARCRQLMAAPPASWDGVWRLATK